MIGKTLAAFLWAIDRLSREAEGAGTRVLYISPLKALAIDVERSITGDDMVMVLERLTAVHGFPQFLRMDNGTEMTSNAIADWCRFNPSGIVFIDPGSPWQNPFAESFNGRLRDELLAVEQFHTLLEAKIMAEDYRQQYYEKNGKSPYCHCLQYAGQHHQSGQCRRTTQD